MKIGIKGFNICIKPSFLFLLLLMIALRSLGQFFIVLIFMTVHELIHILIAVKYGCYVRGITFMPVGLRADIQNLEDRSIWQRIAVTGSAPLFNILFGLMFVNTFVGKANLLIGIFNFMPVYPLDGSRLLSYMGGFFLGTLRVNRYIANISCVLCFSLIFAGFLQLVILSYNISFLLIALYIIKESRKYEQIMAYDMYKTLTSKSRNRIIPVRKLVAGANTQLKTIVYRLGIDYYTVVAVRDRDIITEISEDMLKSFIEKYGLQYELCDIINEYKNA